MPPNAQHLMEDSAAHSSNNGDYEGQHVSKHLSLSLSHTHTHTHIHTRLCFDFSVSVSFFVPTSGLMVAPHIG